MRDTPFTASELHTDLIHFRCVLDALRIIKASIELLPDTGYEKINVENALAWTTGYVESAKARTV